MVRARGAKVPRVKSARYIVVALAALLASAALARAQGNIGGFGPSAQDRYTKRQKGSIASIDEYVRRLESGDADERLGAVRSLGESKDEKAVEYLVMAVGDQDVRVRAKAIDMLGHMRASEATPTLIQYLFLRTTDPQMKSLILAALGKIGDERASKPIVEFLQRDLDNQTKGTAIFALGEIGSSDSEEVLGTVVQSNQDRTLRRLANEALAKVKNRRDAASVEANQPADTFLRKDEEPQ